MGSIKALTDSPSTIDNDNPIKHDHNSAVDGEIQLNTTKESKKKKSGIKIIEIILHIPSPVPSAAHSQALYAYCMSLFVRTYNTHTNTHLLQSQSIFN